MTTLADRFDVARAAVERGWCQGMYSCDREGQRQFCLLVAIGEAAVTDNPQAASDYEIGSAMRQIVDELLAHSAISPVYATTWNDAPGRRKRSVLRLLDTCARVCRERGL